MISVLSLYNDLNKKYFQDDRNKFFKVDEIVFSSLKPKMVVNSVANLIFIKLENIFQNDLNFINFKDQIFIEIIHQEDFSELVNNESEKIIEWIEFFESRQKLILFIELDILLQNNILTAKVVF